MPSFTELLSRPVTDQIDCPNPYCENGKVPGSLAELEHGIWAGGGKRCPVCDGRGQTTRAQAEAQE